MKNKFTTINVRLLQNKIHRVVFIAILRIARFYWHSFTLNVCLFIITATALRKYQLISVYIRRMILSLQQVDRISCLFVSVSSNTFSFNWYPKIVHYSTWKLRKYFQRKSPALSGASTQKLNRETHP